MSVLPQADKQSNGVAEVDGADTSTAPVTYWSGLRRDVTRSILKIRNGDSISSAVQASADMGNDLAGVVCVLNGPNAQRFNHGTRSMQSRAKRQGDWYLR